MFAQARILTRSAEGAMLLPPSAIQRIEGKPFVFVKLADDLFDARAVRLGAKFDGQVEVVDGLEAAGSGRGEPRLRAQVRIAHLAPGRGLRG